MRTLSLALPLLVLAAPLPAQIRLAASWKDAMPELLMPTESVATGDLDRDGRVDLVFGNQGTYQAYGPANRVYRNAGGGRFVDVSALWLPPDEQFTEEVELADVDRDGDLDLVAATFGDLSRLYLNDGTGRLVDATATHLPEVSLRARDVIAFDADRDGDPDLLFGCDLDPCRLFTNDGTGRFSAAPAAFPAASHPTKQLVAVDVDRDADLDVVQANGAGLIRSEDRDRLFINDGAGQFTDETASRMPDDVDDTLDVTAGDVDGDGDADLVFATRWSRIGPRQNRLYVNDGTGRFADVTATRLPLDDDITYAVALGDVDGDLDLDLVFGNHFAPNDVYVNDGTGRFADAGAEAMPRHWLQTSDVALVDADGDLDLDLITANGAFANLGQSRIYYNDGGRFVDTGGELMPADASARGLVRLADLNGDGFLDLLAARYGELLVLAGDRGARFGVPAASPLPNYSITDLAPVDVDGDRDLDIIIGNYLGAHGLLLNTGGGVLANVSATHMPAAVGSTTVIATGDVDRDGDIDAVAGKNGAPNELLRNDGRGVFAAVPGALGNAGNTTALALADFDRDGDLDVLDAKQTSFGPPPVLSGGLRLFANDGTGRFTISASLPVPTQSVFDVAPADYDGDGDLDIVVAGPPSLLINDGTGAFTVEASRLPATGFYGVGAEPVDLDGDGDLDLVIRHLFGSNLIWSNDGQGYFQDVTATAWQSPALQTWYAAVGDVDRDGDADVLAGNADLPGWALYQNLTQQLSAKSVAKLGRRYRMVIDAQGGVAAQLLLHVRTLPAPVATPFGVLHLDLASAITTPVLAMAGTSIALDLPLPNLPVLSGVPLYGQAIVLRAAAGLRLTNLTADRLVR